MKLPVVLAVLIGILVIACSSVLPTGPTSNNEAIVDIEKTVQAMLATERAKTAPPPPAVITYSEFKKGRESFPMGPLGSCGVSTIWPKSEKSEKLDLEAGDIIILSVSAAKPVHVYISIPNRGKTQLSASAVTVFDYTFEAESAGQYRIVISAGWSQNNMAGCRGQEAHVEYDYVIKRPSTS